MNDQNRSLCIGFKKKGNRNSCFIAVIIISVCIVFGNPISAYADNGNTIVHITATGACYHRESCGHLRSDYEITLYEAKKEGYVPCNTCHPPIYDGPPIPEAEPEKQKSTGGNGNKGTRKSTYNNVRADSNPVEHSTKDPKDNSLAGIIGIGFLLVFVGLPIVNSIVGFCCDIREKKKREKENKEKFERTRQVYYEQYANKNPLDLVDVPEGSFIEDGFPCTADKKRGVFGAYTAYVAKKSFKVLHLNPKCGGTELVPINYYYVRHLRHCKRCAMKNVQLPPIDWYIKYLGIKKRKEMYNIP